MIKTRFAVVRLRLRGGFVSKLFLLAWKASNRVACMYLPKCAGAGCHDENANGINVREFIEDLLSSGWRSFAVDSVECDIFC